MLSKPDSALKLLSHRKLSVLFRKLPGGVSNPEQSEVTVIPDTANHMQTGATYGAEVGEVVVAGYVQVAEHLVGSYVECNQLIVSHIQALQEILVRKVEECKAVPGEIYESQVLAVFSREGGQAVVRCIEVTEVGAIVDGELLHMIVADHQCEKHRQILHVKFLQMVGIEIDCLESGQTGELYGAQLIISGIEGFKAGAVGYIQNFQTIGIAVQIVKYGRTAHIKLNHSVAAHIEALEQRSAGYIDSGKLIAIAAQVAQLRAA